MKSWIPHWKYKLESIGASAASWEKHAVLVTHLAQELSQDNKERHQVSRVTREDTLGIAATHVFGSSSHRRRNDFTRCVHQQLSQPFEHFLNDLRVWLLQI